MRFIFETGLRGVEGKPVGLGKSPRRPLSKDEGKVFQPPRPVRRRPFLVCGELLNIFARRFTEWLPALRLVQPSMIGQFSKETSCTTCAVTAYVYCAV